MKSYLPIILSSLKQSLALKVLQNNSEGIIILLIITDKKLKELLVGISAYIKLIRF